MVDGGSLMGGGSVLGCAPAAPGGRMSTPALSSSAGVPDVPGVLGVTAGVVVGAEAMAVGALAADSGIEGMLPGSSDAPPSEI